METPFLDQLIDEHQNHIGSVEASSYAGIQETRKQLAELEAIKAIIVTQSFCGCKEEPSCRMQDNKYYCNTCDKELK